MNKLFVFIIFTGLLAACNPQQPTSDAIIKPDTASNSFNEGNIKERLIYQRAVQAVLWGIPAVNYDLMLQEMLRKTSARQNEVVYWSRPADWHNQTLTPNPDAIYFMIFFNTKDVGPVVIDVPPAGGGIVIRSEY